MHPRKCYYFCAYGYCKFGGDCQFKHEYNTSNVTFAKDDDKSEKDNKELNHGLKKMNAKCEKVQCDLDQLMEHQAKQDLLNNEHIKNEIETIQNKHDLQIEKQTNIINNQNRAF